MNKIKIFVAQHKEAKVFSNDIYTPIHVGKALSKVDLGIPGDDIGENISIHNPNFCELTALYWIWKNVRDTEYVGLCHYRRYFKEQFTNTNISNILGDADILLAQRVPLSTSLLNWWKSVLVPEDIDTFYLYMQKMFSQLTSEFNDFFLGRNWLNPANMFVAKKEIVDDYSAWVFDILFDLKELLPLAGHCREKRILGYLAEGLLPFYAYLKNLKVKEMPLVSMIGEPVAKIPFKKKLQSLKNDIKFKIHKNSTYTIPSDRNVSLANDGILEKIEHLTLSTFPKG